MATNEVFEHGTNLQVACTDPTTPNSGDPCIIGQIPAVCTVTEDANGNASVVTDGVFNLSVKGTSGSNAAIAAGDIVYYVSGNTPKLSVTTSGVRFGYALAPVVSGATTTIPVKLGY